ncbi:MAG: hypothetical protein KF678_02350 [Phycisphaeraceae bacterium]|nr:hypothetical protein [Phycisphaeraceae bacterium]
MTIRNWLATVLLMGLVLVPGCRRGYDQSTPEAVLQSAKQMVEKGDADLLPRLIYADSARMRQLLDELGVVLGSLQELGKAVQKAYPEEIESLRIEAENSAKQGDASGFIARLAGQASQQMSAGRQQLPFGPANRAGRNSAAGSTRAAGGAGGSGAAGAGGADPDAMRKMFDNAMKELFADPYGWIAANEGRLTAQQLADDRAAILWDGKPVLGIGLTMQKADDDKWYIVLPLNAPGIGQIMPKSDESWEIMGSLMAVMDNMLRDLTSDVKRGKARKLDELATLAGEKAFIPAVMVFFAYSKAIEAERKAAREVAKPPA